MQLFNGLIGDEAVATVFAEDTEAARSKVRRYLFDADDGFQSYAQWAEQGARVVKISEK